MDFLVRQWKMFLIAGVLFLGGGFVVLLWYSISYQFVKSMPGSIALACAGPILVGFTLILVGVVGWAVKEGYRL